MEKLKDKFKFVLNENLDEYTDDIFTAERDEDIENMFIIGWEDAHVNGQRYSEYEEKDILQYVNQGDWIILD